jgi:ankyrin repeat protein
MSAFTELRDAIQKGDVQDVKLLLAKPYLLPVTDTECSTILHEAVLGVTSLAQSSYRNASSAGVTSAAFGAIDILGEVLIRSDNVDMLARNQWNETALHIASTFFHPGVMELLISYLLKTNTEHRLPAYLDCKDCNGNTALFWACFTRNVEVVKLLLRFNASSISKNLCGDTALHEVAGISKTRMNIDFEIAHLLIDHDARVLDMKNAESLTPVECAVNDNDTSMVDLFRQHTGTRKARPVGPEVVN